ncbi:type II toxin-antitoxin system RelE family toxin [Legionella bozemanae]|uniref:type II toxin-antitoxin system RelE family toxin n=1 Tax=Legionella bozemanae TaxID=447 RepID=UPI00399CCE51
MAWTINYTDVALKQLKKLDKTIAKRILTYMDTKIAPLPNPRTTGKGLSFNKVGLWRYRIGDYRVICQVNDESVTILVLEVGHRKEIYE